MIADKLQHYKYHIGGVLLAIIGFIVYSVYKNRGSSDKSLPDIQKLTELSDKTQKMSESLAVSQTIPTGDILEFRKLLKVFTHEMKKSTKSLIQFNTDRSSTHNYLNMRNNLFSKDIVTTKLLVDSMSLDHSNTFNPSNFTVVFGGEQKATGNSIVIPNTYKNVIGFRLLKCTIPITPYHIHSGHTDSNNKLTVKENTSAESTKTLPTGVFTATKLAQKTAEKLGTNWTVTFENQSHLFTFTYNGTNSATIYWSQSPVLARVFGFYKEDKVYTKGDPVHSEYVGDFNTTFVDLVIDEIPQIACKDNTKGKPIIDRIPLDQADKDTSRSTHHTNPSEYYTQNFFYPIKLNSLSIKLFLDHDTNIIYDTQKGETAFEFELTILKNTKLMETNPQGNATNLVYSSKST